MRKALLRTAAFLLLSSLVAAQAPEVAAAEFAPYLGLESRVPTAEEVKSFHLQLNVRHRGQVIRRVESGSPAESAGLRVGDALIGLDDNDIYSFDDVRDFVATSTPGRKVQARVKRKGSDVTETVSLQLGKRQLSDQEAKTETLTWDFSSLAQLEAALERARAEKKPVLVGISGAET